MPQKKSLLKEVYLLFQYLSKRRQRQLLILIILMNISAFSEVVSLGIVLPFLSALSDAQKLLQLPQLQPILKATQIDSTTELVTVLAISFIVAAIAANVLRILTLNIQTHLAASIGSDISCEVYNRTISQPYSLYVRYSSNDLISLVTSDSNIFMGGIISPLLLLTTNGLIVISLAFGLLIIDSQVAIISLGLFGAIYIALYNWRKVMLQRNSKIATDSSQQLVKAVQEGLGGIREIQIAGLQGIFEDAYAHADRRLRKALVINTTISYTPRYFIEMVAMTAIALLALSLGQNGDFSQAVPILGGLALAANRLLPALQQTFASVATIQSSRSSLERILAALQRPTNPLQKWLPTEILPLEQELRFEQVWFRYTSEHDWVLRDLNLSIAAKTTVGFVGTTGSGKSTTADLILGLLQPEKGQILLDGKPLTEERLRAWQLGIAHVPQSIFLTDATIAENIAFGIPLEEIDPEKVQKAAYLAKIDQFIETQPAGYNTYVGERGIRLSGGQRQRVGIARALYRNASVIVFDEATSALDNATEKEVMAAINGLGHHLTIILIAHRLSTIEKCDRIFEFSKGQVVASGTYDELLEKSASFRKMAAH